MILSGEMLAQTLARYRNPADKITRMVKNKELFRIKPGWFETEPGRNPCLYAPLLCFPSYISFEYVLSACQLIPEHVVEITCAGFDRKKELRRQNGFGTYSFRDVPKRVFALGLRYIQEGHDIYWIAGPEKALCDLLYKKEKLRSLTDMEDLLFEDLRVDEDLFLELDGELLKQIASSYRSTNVSLMYRIFQKRKKHMTSTNIHSGPSVLEERIRSYHPVTEADRLLAIREILQEIVLAGLADGSFFEKAAFYGGTALRIFYGLDRFSEDLDFSMIQPDENFDLQDYFPKIESLASSLGLRVDLSRKTKTSGTGIQSAFMKSSTIEQYLTFYPDSPLPHMNPDQKTKIKFEIDTDPPAGARTETRLLNFPAMKKISLYSPDSLFAGKIHAILCRSWKNRTKGRDLYDFQFYLQNDIPVNLENLRFKLIQSGYVSPDETISLDWLKTELSRRFRTINYDQAIRDVRPFLQPESYQQISQWGAELFELMCQKLKAAV